MRCRFQSSEITLSYLQWNQGTEPLLLLHGMADLGLVWSSLAESLAQKYHIVAPDLRGHGASSKPETGYSCQDIINDLEALMDDLGWSNAHILGHSWGGKVAASWANNHPQRFRSLILVDPFYVGKLPSWLKVTFPLLYRVLPFLQGMKPYASYEAAATVAQKLKQYQGWSKLQQQVFQASIEQKADGSWGSKFPRAARDGIFADVMSVASFTKQIDVPTLLIKPDAGLNRSQWQLLPYFQYLTNLKIQEIKGNHWVFLTNAPEFNHIVAEYLEKVNRTA